VHFFPCILALGEISSLVRFKNCDIVNQLCVSHKLHLLSVAWSEWIACDCHWGLRPVGGKRVKSGGAIGHWVV